MANEKLEQAPNYPFSAFRFAVEIKVPGMEGQLYSGYFAECDGLEMTMEVKTIREGGNNGEQVRLTGPLSYGTLTLKRGMTANRDMWDLFNLIVQPGKANLRANAEVVIFTPNGEKEQARFILGRCLPIKLKAPALNAQSGIIAIEEMQLAYESMMLKRV